MYRFLLLFFLIFLDFFVKQQVFKSIDLNTFKKITFFLDFTHIHNFGISFGLFSGLVSSWVFIFLGLLVTLMIIVIYFRSHNYIEKIGFLFIISGAFSNIFDRIYNGYVIDFIYLHYNQFYWPAFNFADIYISIGILLLIFQYFKDWVIKKK